MIISIRFRDEEHDVRITHNGGYEPDTNAHDISWEWVDNEMNKIELTANEEQLIYDQLIQITEENYCDEDY